MSSTRMNIEQIMEVLPHRYPILLVDRIEELTERSCVGLKNVTMNEAFFQGHYPGRPIMPGVLIIEAMAQAGAIILLVDPKYSGWIPVIGGIDDVKFRRPVVPGDQLRTEVEVMWIKGTVGRIKCVSTVEGELAAQMELTFKMLQKE